MANCETTRSQLLPRLPLAVLRDRPLYYSTRLREPSQSLQSAHSLTFLRGSDCGSDSGEARSVWSVHSLEAIPRIDKIQEQIFDQGSFLFPPLLLLNLEPRLIMLRW